jgi:uncharacterized membrane protein
VDILQALFRWLHIFAGIIWIGMLYFFNWVNGPLQAKLDADTKKKLVPELMPRALFWFRWGAAWTWITGVLLLGLVFWHGKLVFGPEVGNPPVPSLVVWLLVLGAPFVYDALHKTVGKDPKIFGTIAFVAVALVLWVMAGWAGLTYRAFNIHLAALFGTIMAFNVWFRIWPAQQKIITAVKEGTAPDAGLVAMAGARSRHNVYMSVPLVWGMIDQHTTAFAGGNLGIPGELSFLVYLAVILVGWHIVWQLYRRAAKVQGF